MKSLLFFLVLSGAALAEPHVLMVTIDGMRPEHYQAPGWDSPTLHRLTREGASARAMLPVFPSLTYVNHTTLVTGVTPARHGIVGNEIFDWQRGQLTPWAWDAARVHVPTLFDRARAAHLTTAAFSWPVTVGAPVDWLVPEIFQVPGLPDDTRTLVERSSSAEITASNPPLDFTRGAPLDGADRWMTHAFIGIWKKHRPRLGLIHLVNVDWMSHHHGPNSPEAHSALHEVDAELGELVAAVDRADTTVMVMGDHGFREYRSRVSLNRVFRDKGWIQLAANGHVASWTVIADSQGAASAIYCKDPALEREVLELVAATPGCALVDRAALDALGTLPAALCGVSARDGFAFTANPRAPIVETLPRVLGQHGYLPEQVPTGFIAWGQGVAAGRDLGTFRNLSVAPTVCALLGLPADGMEGAALQLR